MARTYLVFGDIDGKLDVLRVECARCQRKGRYSVRRLRNEVPMSRRLSALSVPLAPTSLHCSKATSPLLEHRIGGRERRRRHGEAEQSGGLVVDDQLELARLHNRQVRGLGTLEGAAGINADLTIRVSQARRLTSLVSGLMQGAEPILERASRHGRRGPV